MLAALLLGNAARASAQMDIQLSAQAIFWATSNKGNYSKYVSYARNGAKPQVPVPPMVDPPCHLCGDTTKTQGETQVAAWVAQSQEPELTYIQELLAMDKQIQQFNGAKEQLSPAAQKALSQFEDDAGFMADAGKLADRLLNGKAIPMAQSYDKEPKQAYAGTLFLLTVTRDAALIQGWSSSQQEEDQVLQLVKVWEQSISNKIDSDIVSGHQYNLCPVYSSIVRTVEMLGGPETDIANYTKMLQKMQDLVKFNVNLNLTAVGNEKNGSHYNIAWQGKAKLKLNLDMANSCYTPEWDGTNGMQVNVQNFTMVNFAKQDNGTVEQIPVTLTSSRSFNVALPNPQLNLCDPNPLFQFPTAGNYPPETIMVKGHESKASFFGEFLGAVIATNEINSAATNKVTGQAPSLPGGSQPSSGDSGSQSLNAAKSAIDAHKGDVGWLMSAAGQAAIAQMQQGALQTAQSKMAAKGVVVPTASSFAQLGQSLGSAHLPWTNGSVQPVNKTLHVTKDNNTFTLTISVQQASQ
jgi:hypothetical protein